MRRGRWAHRYTASRQVLRSSSLGEKRERALASLRMTVLCWSLDSGSQVSSGTEILIRVKGAVAAVPVLSGEDAVALPADGHHVAAGDAAGLGVDLDQLDRFLAAWTLESLRFARGSHRSSPKHGFLKSGCLHDRA